MSSAECSSHKSVVLRLIGISLVAGPGRVAPPPIDIPEGKTTMVLHTAGSAQLTAPGAQQRIQQRMTERDKQPKATASGRAMDIRALLGTYERPILLGVAGDSGSGKTTYSNGIRRLLGNDIVTSISLDGYHKEDRAQRRRSGRLPLDPAANHLELIRSHLAGLRTGKIGGNSHLQPSDRFLRYPPGHHCNAGYHRGGTPRPVSGVRGVSGLHLVRGLRPGSEVALEDGAGRHRPRPRSRRCRRRNATSGNRLQAMDRLPEDPCGCGH